MSRTKRVKLAAVTLIALLLTACAEETLPEEAVYYQGVMQASEINYSMETAKLGDYEQVLGCEATVAYPLLTTVRLEAPEAEFSAYSVGAGDVVKEGDLLATFTKNTDSVRVREIELEIKRLKADEEADLEARNRELTNFKEDVEEMEIPYYDEEARDRVSLRIQKMELGIQQVILETEESLRKLREELAELQAAEAALNLYAPCDGQVVETAYIREGTTCYENTPVVTLTDTSAFVLRARDSMKILRLGMEVTVNYGRKNERLQTTGRVIAASNVLPSELQSEIALVQLDDASIPASDLINPNVTGTAVSIKNALLVPRRTVASNGGQYYVSILNEGMIQKRFVLPGFLNAETVWVLLGLEEGQQLILQ